MSLESALKFFVAARDDAALLARYDQRNLSQLLFHAKNDGFDFPPGTWRRWPAGSRPASF